MATSPEKWETVKALFGAALELDSSERSAFLRENCPDDEARAEVERLLNEHDQAGTFLSTPMLGSFSLEAEAPTQELSESQLLAGRFRILRFIAGGGMGEVYEAEDQELRERVAIKTIRPEILAQPNAMARFKREVHLARKVTHPNVCRIFDLFRHRPDQSPGEDIVFISMELLLGDHLGKRLKDGDPMCTEEALSLIQQMASALAAAHAAGIIHRDFKPQNVLLVPAPGKDPKRAVVTDFGLALQSETSGEAPSFSTGQGLRGTPAYMSPEQVEGRTATVASDIYALGLVIYEMVTGSRPFQGATPMSAAIKRLSVAPTPPRKLKPGLSPVWESVILRCLERDPGKRFANAEDVARALAGERTTASRISAMPALNRRRTLIVLCALLIVGAGLRYEMKHWRGTSEKKAAIHTRRSVAVLGFKNLSGRAEEAWLSTALSYQLTTALAAGEQVRTVPGEVLDQMRVSLRLGDADGYGRDTLARIQRVVDADDVLVGSYLALGKETGGKVHLDLKLQNIGDGETAAAILEDGTEDQLPELVSRAGAALLKKLGVRELNPTQTDELKAFVSSNPEANRWYAEGLAKLRTDDAVAARDVLQKAIGADPSYAPAHSALALAWSQLGYDAESQDEAKKAFDRSASLSREQRLNIEARYYVAAHQWDKAADVYHTLFEFFPDNLEYGLDLAAAQLNGGKAKIAQDTVGALRALPPPSGNDPRIELVQAQAFEALGDLGSAKAAAARAAEEARLQGSRWIQGRAEVHLCFYLSNLGDFAPALTACEEAEQIYAATDDRGGLAKALMNTGNLLADEGEFAKAKAKYEKAITNYQQIGNRIDLAWALNNLGTAVIELSDYSGARKVHQQALALFQETQQRRGQAASYYNLANVARSDGNLNEAASDLGQALAIQRELGDKRRVGLVVQNLAELDYLRGKLQDARENAQAAADTGRTLGSKQILADALTALGSVQNAEFQTKEAKSTWQAAESVYVELGQKRGRALCWTELARISIDEGSLPQAGELAQNAIDAYHSEKDDEHEAVAHLVLSQTRLAEGDVSGARRQLSQAAGLSRNNFARQTRWALIVGTARVRAATGAVSEALHALESVHNEMANLGYLTESMETRFVFDKIEMNAGRATARADLTRLEIDARAKGFLLIAHKAAEAKGGPHETRT